MRDQVKHDEHHQRFLMELGAYQAFLVYAQKGKVLDFLPRFPKYQEFAQSGDFPFVL